MTDAMDDDIICMDTIKPRKIKPQNIVCRILSRERGYVKKKTKNFVNSVICLIRIIFVVLFQL